MKKIILLFAVWALSVGLRAQDPWQITVSPTAAETYFGATIANGQLGVVSSRDPLRVERVVLGGVYDIYGRGRVANFVHGIKMLDVELRLDGETMRRGNIDRYTQTLDMRRGALCGSFDFGSKAHVGYAYRALRHLPFCVMLEVEVTPHQDLALRAENILEIHESLRDTREYFVTVRNGQDKYGIASSTALTPTGAQVVGASAVILADTIAYDVPVAEHWSNRGVGVHSQVIEVALRKGKPYKFYVVGSTLAGASAPDVRNDVERLALFCAVEGPDRLIARHTAAWERLWESDIRIEGDARAQQEVRAMLFNLYGSVREGSGLSVSPMGLSGFGYNGHVFWDCETWAYPPLLVLHPELAQTWMDFRYQTLPEAKRNAYQYGCPGAKYPWESVGSGREETPAHNLYGQLEIHVTADVAIAAWQYYQVTKDRRWLADKGFPIIEACADYFAHRADRGADGGYDLVNVISADEWNVNPRGGKQVDNNAYTIGAVKQCLGIAAQAATLLGEPVRPLWQEVADGLTLKTMPNGVTLEHDSYRPGTTTKQADVSLLSYPLGIITDPDQVRRNLEYYLATVPRKATPAMSKSVYSILYSFLGDKEQAWLYFVDSYRPNMQGPFGVIAEFDGGTNPYFITGAGGTLQAILMGFAGLRITDDGIRQVAPSLPDGWKRLTITGVGPDKQTFTVGRGKGQE